MPPSETNRMIDAAAVTSGIARKRELMDKYSVNGRTLHARTIAVDLMGYLEKLLSQLEMVKAHNDSGADPEKNIGYMIGFKFRGDGHHVKLMENDIAPLYSKAKEAYTAAQDVLSKLSSR